MSWGESISNNLGNRFVQLVKPTRIHLGKSTRIDLGKSTRIDLDLSVSTWGNRLVSTWIYPYRLGEIDSYQGMPSGMPFVSLYEAALAAEGP
jgi:hypothetical protein